MKTNILRPIKSGSKRSTLMPFPCRKPKIITIRLWNFKIWSPGELKFLMKPEFDWEGANIKPKSSEYGSIKKTENALRDPFIYEKAGKVFLFYCVQGEKAIVVAEIKNF